MMIIFFCLFHLIFSYAQTGSAVRSFLKSVMMVHGDGDD